jgi:SprT-like family
MPLINTFIDLENNQEWSVVNMESNVQQMFDKMKDHYFQKWLKLVDYKIKWDKTGIISDDSCFKIFEAHKEVLIKSTAMVRPRIQLVSVLFHILIHVYLATVSKGTIKINTHDEIFRKIMIYLNETLNTQISVRLIRFSFVKFTDSFPFSDISQVPVLG